MDLKHVEELAKDKDITYAYMVSIMRTFCAISRDYEYKEDVPKCWEELTDEEKEDLLNTAWHIYLEDNTGASLGRICDLVMEYQQDIEGMDMTEILEILADYECC